MVSTDLTESVTRLMAALNRIAAETMARFDVHACTDVTGFGLLGHLAEMVHGSGCSARVFAERIPVIEDALTFAAMGLIPAGAYKNREFRKGMIETADGVARERQDILFDPQTSGGLLICVPEALAEDLVAALKDAGLGDAAKIGEIVDAPAEKIRVA
jgi:selenide,water dikinase